MRTKRYNKSASVYAQKLKDTGYSVTFNWTDTDGEYSDVTVRGRLFNGYGTEFSTPRQAYEYISKQVK